jgi:hypothetical protein
MRNGLKSSELNSLYAFEKKLITRDFGAGRAQISVLKT